MRSLFFITFRYLTCVILYNQPLTLDHWMIGLIMSVIVGGVLQFNSYDGKTPIGEYIKLNAFKILRFFLIPFCVATYSALSARNPTIFIYIFPKEYFPYVITIASSIVILTSWIVCRKLRGKKEEEQ